jgi:hypothetical protein
MTEPAPSTPVGEGQEPKCYCGQVESNQIVHGPEPGNAFTHPFAPEPEGGPSELSREGGKMLLRHTDECFVAAARSVYHTFVPPPLETGATERWEGFDEAYTSFWTGWFETHPGYMTPATYPSFQAGWKAARAPLERQVESLTRNRDFWWDLAIARGDELAERALASDSGGEG